MAAGTNPRAVGKSARLNAGATPALGQDILFMVLAMGSGMDSFILNPNDKAMMGFVHAGKALIGKDPMTMGYLKAFRSGIYEN